MMRPSKLNLLRRTARTQRAGRTKLAQRRPKFELLEARLALALTLDVVPTTILEGSFGAAVLTRTGSLTSPLTVMLSGTNDSRATVPASVVIPANNSSVQFQVTAPSDGKIDGSTTVTFTAFSSLHGSASDNVQIVNTDVAVLRPAPNSDIINLAPRTEPNQFNVTSGPLAAPSIGPPAYASFVGKNYYQTAGANQSIQSDDYIPVDLAKTYALRGWAKSGDEFGERYQTANSQSFGYASYDADHKPILPEHVLRFTGAADTTLSQPLNPGDTVIRLTSAAGWSNAAGAAAATRGIAWYGYQNSQGTTYANYTYTRNVALGGAAGLWNPGAVNGNVITLAKPWSGPALPAGAAIRNTGAGSAVAYAALDSAPVPGDWTWTQYAALFGGQVAQNGADSLTQFRPGTAYIKTAILVNEQGGINNFVSWRDVTVTPVAAGTTAAQLAAPIIDLSTITAGDQRQSLPNPVGNVFAWSNALVRINTAEKYTLSARGVNASQIDERPMGFVSLDVDKKLIHPIHVAKYSFAADTTLAASLSPGDTSLLITSASGWSTDVWEPAHTRSLAWYGYTDTTGHTYANYTYTRNVAADFDDGLWAPDAIHYDDVAGAYRVTLRHAWTGPALAAGAAVRNAAGGEAYNQPPVAPALAAFQAERWTDYAATIGGGVWQNGQVSDTAFRPGTAYIQPIFTSSLWTNVVIAPQQDAIYGGPTDPTRRILEAPPSHQISLDLDVLNKGALGGGASVVIHAVATPSFGTATIVAGAGPGGRTIIRYISPTWFVGTDVVAYTLRNTTTNETFTASAAITVLGGNEQQTPSLVATLAAQALVADNPAPSTRDDVNYRAVAGQPLVVDVLAGPGVLANDSDGTDVNVARLVRGPANGSLRLNADGSFTYTPFAGFSGIDTFQYEAFDGLTASRATAQINVSLTAEGLSLTQLHDIALGMLNYESAKNRFPLATTPASNFDAGGNPYLSWRVHILPYLGPGYEDLYAQFHLNEPWDSPNNLPLASKMPDIFRDPAAAGATTTRFQIISGEGAPYYWRRSGDLLVGPRFNDFADGSQNSLLVVEVGANQANAWTKPDDLDFDANNPLSALGAISPRGINAVMADGSTITLLPTIAPETFKSLVTIAGDEIVDAGTLRRQFVEPQGAAALQTFGALASENYFRQIAFAMLNHESARASFPVNGLSDAAGNPLLSWRVHLLPFFGYSELYSQFHLDEPWDSENNLPLLDKMPDVFRSAGDASTTTSTRIVTFYGEGAPFRPGLPEANIKGITQAAIQDGTGNTIMFFEAGAEVAEPWTRPTGVPFLKINPLSAAGTFPAGVIRAMKFDANAITLPADIDAPTISALATHAGKESVDAATIAARELHRAGYYDRSQETVQNLRDIVIAMLNFESAQRAFPANSFSASGQPLLSWRVRILPFLGYSNLYQKFKLNEPWDSPNNLALLAEMPDVFRTPGDPWNSATTRAMEFTGTGAPFPATGTNTTTGPSQASIRDGTSGTFAIVESGRDVVVPWTKPSDLPYRPNNPFSVLGDLGPNLIPAFFDGHIGTQLATISSDALNAYITHNGSESTQNPPVVPNVANFYIRHTGGDTATGEFGVDVFDVLLDKAPLANVVVTLGVSNTGIATLDRTTATFTPANWNVPQRFALRGVDNHAVNPHRTVTVAVSVGSTDPAYDVPSQSFIATIRDDLGHFTADANGDARVTGDDFLVWQRNLGTTTGATAAQGDYDQDSDVDSADLVRWRAQFGAVAGASPVLAAAVVAAADDAAPIAAVAAIETIKVSLASAAPTGAPPAGVAPLFNSSQLALSAPGGTPKSSRGVVESRTGLIGNHASPRRVPSDLRRTLGVPPSSIDLTSPASHAVRDHIYSALDEPNRSDLSEDFADLAADLAAQCNDGLAPLAVR